MTRSLLNRTVKVLKNGMKVILVSKPDYQKSLFMIGIPAGGMNVKESERSYRTGSAHFLEHQMFRLNGEDVTPLLAGMQAQSNAFTGYTETCYYVSTTANPLPALKVLIDFVQNLDITKESVEKEKGVILSEYSIYDNYPDNRLLKAGFKALYQKHPLKEDILGTREDIQNMSVQDLSDFYHTYYDPGQLVLIGVTGKNIDEIMDFIEKQEENYPSSIHGAHSRVFPDEPEELALKNQEIVMDVARPYALMAVKLKPEGNVKDNLKYDYMLNIWLDSIFSTLNPQFQKWLDQRLITQSCGAEADCAPDHQYIFIYSQTDQPEAFFKEVNRILDEKQPIDPEVFEALRIQNIASEIRSTDDFDAIAYGEVKAAFGGYEPGSILEVISKTTLQETDQFISSLDLSRRAELIVRPKNQTEDIKEEKNKTEAAENQNFQKGSAE